MSRTPARRQTVQQIKRFFAVVGFVAILGMGLIVVRIFGIGLPWESEARQGLVFAAFNKSVVLISGHAGFDSGAVCLDPAGEVTLTEADVNAEIAAKSARRLRMAGADTLILDEYDERLDALRADVLLSLHADSCIDASGYKAAFHAGSQIPFINDGLVACIGQHYAAATGLTLHPNTITHNMTEYHAFRRIDPQTPAAILELGFLGGDRILLTEETDRVARGVADSVLCFLRNMPASQAEDEVESDSGT